MAMNNWGGVREHMTKKPRKFFAHKRVQRELGKDSSFQLGEEQVKQAEGRRQKWVQREMIIYTVFFVVVILGIILLSKEL